jgi:hypothetical protein
MLAIYLTFLVMLAASAEECNVLNFSMQEMAGEGVRSLLSRGSSDGNECDSGELYSIFGESIERFRVL